MKSRTVSRLLYAHQADMGGLPIRQPLPTQQVQQIDPFLLLHHANIKVPKHVETDHAGVGPHPHRGFSPVTFIFQGGVHHRDSRGNDSTIYAGGAQWMNAGMGIIHSERPPHDIHEIGSRQEIIQLWINTPAKNKMDQPAYFPLASADVPAIKSDDGLITVKIFAGELLGVKGPVPSQAVVNAATAELKKGGKISIPLPSHHNVLLYLLDGKLNVDGFGMVEELHLIQFNNDGDGISLSALADTRVLLLSGEPLNEPVVAHGPFVMNNQTQILEAMRDYQLGKMGVLIEE
ncbi:MAG TPA: pirin family protein [Cyclobacteriaceae bacterium]|nr:pirin family protein [Cyclobacteriaceae bacterium]HRJ82537.1 pirin family protein [Cyclobacteriaceae bacterium]